MAGSATPHVVVLPFAQQGHINPLMQLSRCLASRGFSVTFVLSENTVAKNTKASFPSNLRIAGVPDLLPPERSSGSSFRDSFDSMLNMEPGFRDLLLHRLPPVSLLIYDAFMLWSASLASQLSIPSYCFFTSNATACSLFLHIPSLISRGILPFPRDDNGCLPSHPIQDIPGVPPLLPADFAHCLTFDSSHFRYKFVVNICECLGKASAIILNTFEELEGAACAALRKKKPTYAVGPLLLLSGSPTRLDVNYWPEQDECLTWLSTREASSVLYISFGSVASLPVSYLKELALGLEASEQPFLWVIRPDSVDASVTDALPEGFLDRTKDRGLIISWGPQLLVLSHPSVGGFLTHGGWNSIIENLSTGGVPMICWPHVAEQRMNRRLLVDYWKMGMEFQHREDGSVEKEEVEKVVRCLMQGEEGKEMRKASKMLSEMAKKAAAEGGSSHRNFQEPIEAVRLANLPT